MIAARQRVPPRPPDGSAATALLALLAVALGLWAFAALTDEVLEGETHAFDEAVLLALRSAGDPDDPLGPAWLERSLGDVTALGGYPVVALIAVIAAGYLLVRRLWAGTLLVPAVVVLGALGNELMKRAVGRPRPDLVAHGIKNAHGRVSPGNIECQCKAVPCGSRRRHARSFAATSMRR